VTYKPPYSAVSSISHRTGSLVYKLTEYGSQALSLTLSSNTLQTKTLLSIHCLSAPLLISYIEYYLESSHDSEFWTALVHT